MKVLKNDEALPSEIDSRAFLCVNKTRQLPILEQPPLSFRINTKATYNAFCLQGT